MFYDQELLIFCFLIFAKLLTNYGKSIFIAGWKFGRQD